MCVRACGRRNRNLNRPRDGQQVLSSSRFNRPSLWRYTRARGGVDPLICENRTERTGPLRHSPISFVWQPELLIYRREKRFLLSQVGRAGARVALWLEVCIVHRSMVNGQKERKTERCRLTQARLEVTGDKPSSRSGPTDPWRFGLGRREKGDWTSALAASRCLFLAR